MIEEIDGTMADLLAEKIVAHPISRAVQTIEWDPNSLDMRVTFTSGRVYDYPGVTREQVQNLISAPSVGQYLNQNFKGWK